MHADTFDNVKGPFPIGFYIWNCKENEVFTEYEADVFDKNGQFLGMKKIYAPKENQKNINDWRSSWASALDKNSPCLGYLVRQVAADIQHNMQVAILSIPQTQTCLTITQKNLIFACVYFAVRQCIKATWLNDRDQFLFLKDDWKGDREFQLDCIIFTLFHGQNSISAKQSENHFIPFTETEVDAKDSFDSHFMADFLCDFKSGKIGIETENGLFETANNSTPGKACAFSTQAQAVFDAGRALWTYYHAQDGTTPNASFYDMREHFQGRDTKTSKMKNSSSDMQYMRLIAGLREKQNVLAAKIAEKVYEYGFLK